jgi:hypothetical protein
VSCIELKTFPLRSLLNAYLLKISEKLYVSNENVFPKYMILPTLLFLVLYIVRVKSLTTSKTYFKANCTPLSQEKFIFHCIYLNIYNSEM